MANVTVHPFIDHNRNTRVVYATMHDENGNAMTGLGATLDYCISVAENAGDTITNSQEVLGWLHRNVEFSAG